MTWQSLLLHKTIIILRQYPIKSNYHPMISLSIIEQINDVYLFHWTEWRDYYMNCCMQWPCMQKNDYFILYQARVLLLNLLCFKTLSADNLFRIATLYKFGWESILTLASFRILSLWKYNAHSEAKPKYNVHFASLSV